jgi:hypothetical protein
MTPSEMLPVWTLMAKLSAVWLAVGAIPLLSCQFAPDVRDRFLLWFVVPGTAGCFVAFIMLLLI